MLVQLAHETDLAGFRREARALLARGVHPAQVHWSCGVHHDDLFATTPEPAAQAPAPGEPAVPVPAAFVTLCESVVLHADAQRFGLLYRLLWRLVHEPQLRHDPLDADWIQARAWARAVDRELHKMRAFVRFRPVADDRHPDDPLQVAWFEPEHHIVDANAPWFRRRFANMRWAILTPRRCVEWDRQRLHFRSGARREEAPGADAGEQLWLTYYRSIFNPARLKLETMQQHMPRRYWRNLPEAQLITPLAGEAVARSGAMVLQPPTTPRRKLEKVTVRVAAPAAGSLAALEAGMQACRACPIGAGATQAVPGAGPLQPRLMFVGEQPGDQEDLAGRPFVGPAGQLLDRALRAAGIERAGVYLTNAVRHFKYELRGQRRIHKTPSQQEALACAHWLEDEIALVQPGALVALGATAARSLLGHDVAIRTEHGQWFTRPDGRRVLVTWHPSALLRLAPQERERGFEAFVADLVEAGR